ncbi:MAG: hypothetical protein DRH32_05320 [Deltaproteobacteria bacterium]|nr:MAG: hypothetical protein DRH32_05320 [Deltaproteobacteria bacterium]
MTDVIRPDINIGLSPAEKNDLEKLIKEFSAGQNRDTSISPVEEIQKQLAAMKKLLARHGEMLMKFDSRMKAFYEIIRLTHEKTEIMNSRINTVIETIKE